MPASEIRKGAREALSGKWGKAVCIILVYMALSFVIGFIEGLVGEGTLLYSIIDLAYAIITVPLSFGLIISFMKLKRGEEVSVLDFLKDGFSRFGRSWGIALHTLLRMLLPIICVVLVAILMTSLALVNNFSNTSTIATPTSSILSIISIVLYIATLVYVVSRGLLYSLAYNIGYDNPELSSKECVVKSAELMKGNRGNLFLLELSFIGWAILAVFTLGIGMLWLMPYMQVALVCFYERVKEKNTVEDAIKTEE